MRKQLVYLAAAITTLPQPFLAACTSSPQEEDVGTCIQQRDPAAGQARVEIHEDGDSIVLLSRTGYVGSLAGRTEKIRTRAYDNRKTKPVVSELVVTPPPKDKLDTEPDGAWTEQKPIAAVAGAPEENQILSICWQEARIRTQMARATPEPPRRNFSLAQLIKPL